MQNSKLLISAGDGDGRAPDTHTVEQSERALAGGKPPTGPDAFSIYSISNNIPRLLKRVKRVFSCLKHPIISDKVEVDQPPKTSKLLKIPCKK